jgi:hypothetical protein
VPRYTSKASTSISEPVYFGGRFEKQFVRVGAMQNSSAGQNMELYVFFLGENISFKLFSMKPLSKNTLPIEELC